MAHSHLVAEAAEVQQLPPAARAQSHEPLKLREVANAEQLPDISLKMGLDVVAKPEDRIEGPVEERRVAATNNRLIDRWQQERGGTEF